MAIQTNQDLYAKLWNGAEQLRGSMEAAKYKDYMLGIMFYKFLSDKTLATFAATADIRDDVYAAYMEYHDNPETMKIIYNGLIQELGYYVQPDDLYQTWIRKIENNEFEVANIENAINNFQRNVQESDSRNDFDGLFSSLSVNSPDLGKDLNERNKNLRSLIKLFADMDMNALQETDVLGDAYEYLVGQFGMESGKKAGEFYTPRQVSEVMAQVVTNSTDSIKNIYDPTVGSGGLLLTVAKHLPKDDQRVLQYFGQEYNTATYNLTRMNLLLHGVQPDHMTINNGDTLRDDWPENPLKPQQSRQFDAVVMNPPYSNNWSAGDDSAYSHASLQDPRYQDYGALAPKTKADFAFLLHGLYHLDLEGAMAIVLPHGVLFRGGDEGMIRENLIKKNQIDAIIGMPSSLFTNTGIPVVVMVLKKNRVRNDVNDILFIDAAEGFVKDGKVNKLRERDIAKIVDVIKTRKEVVGFSHLASLAEIKRNEFNLNIPRYVTPIEKMDVQDVDGHLYGGIPSYALQAISVLNTLVQDEFKAAFEELRPGYFSQKISDAELRENIITAPAFQELKQTYENKIDHYREVWFERLLAISEADVLMDFKAEMVNAAKAELGIDKIVDEYAAYQVIAELWEKYLLRDTELIQKYGVLESGRALRLLVKTKMKNGRQVEIPDGEEGELLPKVLVQKVMFTDAADRLATVQADLDQITDELNSLIEEAAAKEDFDGILFEEGTLKSKKDQPKLKDLDANADIDVLEFLNNQKELETRKKAVAKDYKLLQSELEEKTLELYATLTEEQIRTLLAEKWFGTFKNDVAKLLIGVIDAELNEVKALNHRYSDTLLGIQEQKKSIEASFLEMTNQLIKG